MEDTEGVLVFQLYPVILVLYLIVKGEKKTSDGPNISM